MSTRVIGKSSLGPPLRKQKTRPDSIDENGEWAIDRNVRIVHFPMSNPPLLRQSATGGLAGGGGSRTLTPLPAGDFKSPAYAISPHPRPADGYFIIIYGGLCVRFRNPAASPTRRRAQTHCSFLVAACALHCPHAPSHLGFPLAFDCPWIHLSHWHCDTMPPCPIRFHPSNGT